jgi:hypothetical protein
LRISVVPYALSPNTSRVLSLPSSASSSSPISASLLSLAAGLDEPAGGQSRAGFDRNMLALLALIAEQDAEAAQDSDGTDGRWRIARRVAPGDHGDRSRGPARA